MIRISQGFDSATLDALYKRRSTKKWRELKKYQNNQLRSDWTSNSKPFQILNEINSIC